MKIKQDPQRDLTDAERLFMQYVLMSIPTAAADELKLSLAQGQWQRVIEIISAATQDTVNTYRVLADLFETIDESEKEVAQVKFTVEPVSSVTLGTKL
jgi:hypothetical protein